MDIVTKTLIDVMRDLQDIDITSEDIQSGKSLSEFDLDSIDSIELLLEVEDRFDEMDLPDFDNAELANLKEVWQYITDHLPESYKS